MSSVEAGACEALALCAAGGNPVMVEPDPTQDRFPLLQASWRQFIDCEGSWSECRRDIKKAVFRRQPFPLLPPPENIADPIQVVGNADALDHPMMQVEPIVEVGRHHCTSLDPKDLMRFQPAVVEQQGFIRLLQRRRQLFQGSFISPADVVLGDVVAASFDTLPDALDVPFDRIQGNVIKADRKPGRLRVAHQVDGLLAAQGGLVNERCLRFDHLSELADCRPARCHARRSAVTGSGQLLGDLIGIDPNAVGLQLRIGAGLAGPIRAAENDA